jgi:tryptophan 2,3-dioxygenase
MLNEELRQDAMDAEAGVQEPLTYGAYLHVPQILSQQVPLGEPPVHDEMLFIIVQQVQELWFKQVLFELHTIIGLLQERNILEATRFLTRVNRVIQAVTSEVDILALMPPREFHRFRHVLTPSSGFESLQFRELELASGLNDPTFLKVMDKYIGLDLLNENWPVTLREAAYSLLPQVAKDPTEAWARIYNDTAAYPELFALAEVLSEYEVHFGEWRFHHIKLVERSIGGHVPGTAGSAGASYLSKTLQYRFFPELWEARNRVTQMNS